MAVQRLRQLHMQARCIFSRAEHHPNDIFAPRRELDPQGTPVLPRRILLMCYFQQTEILILLLQIPASLMYNLRLDLEVCCITRSTWIQLLQLLQLLHLHHWQPPAPPLLMNCSFSQHQYYYWITIKSTPIPSFIPSPSSQFSSLLRGWQYL